MGTWGTKLFQDDWARDIRDEYIDKLKRGKSTTEVEQEILESYKNDLGSDDEYMFWFALAVTEWEYGRLSDIVKEKALYYVKHGDFSVWEDAKNNGYEKWLETIKEIEEKLLSPQPKEKKVRKYNFYVCKWNIGDVFAYQLTSDLSKEKGYYGKYIVFRKIDNIDYWPGHVVPVINFYKKSFDVIPTIDELKNISLQEVLFFSTVLEFYPNEKRVYEVQLVTEREKQIPYDNLFYIGNLLESNRNIDLSRKYSGALATVSWQTTSYNGKIEKYFIEMYESWKEY